MILNSACIDCRRDPGFCEFVSFRPMADRQPGRAELRLLSSLTMPLFFVVCSSIYLKRGVFERCQERHNYLDRPCRRLPMP